ncbi:hypothetical protein [Paraburkholderia sacchari]|uniref:hypothetical protein n=1 Tax=Paraburkholderia sacchari TaxID=159450 RepID=UPI003D98833F
MSYDHQLRVTRIEREHAAAVKALVAAGDEVNTIKRRRAEKFVGREQLVADVGSGAVSGQVGAMRLAILDADMRDLDALLPLALQCSNAIGNKVSELVRHLSFARIALVNAERAEASASGL